MESFSVIFYETPNGEQPAKLFLNELSEKQRAKTIRDLNLTNGFVKKSMKTPRNAIELALKYKQDYIERYT
ncbi:MAG: toxin-antitoxin system, toxin component [Veillonella sp.]|uniref:toxin-antitoxin system, toxin component n=1 Tax=Veillonella TaxID=29465 RepID=UPI001CACC6B3|nr:MULTISPECIES: toxin-antitoxin system, toxin component [Veillonella]MBF1729881.1 toxin-antitoxin system, toxin component [Veillonella sp.]MDE8713590.1 toxin-antitoxin system, toxin component [Veillonella atypica]MDU4149083.1 toxin-antitoxin system, toxin component [Veillonella sp.]MDU6398392.1 toxin-antitoxin system, toxin component [Veillonella sp.]MDU6571582.1 toxin-antitoxin system, toxin component [Veillonella sp.]